MLPSLLPAFSAPSGVRLVFRVAASSAVAAWAASGRPAAQASAMAPARMVEVGFMICSMVVILEGALEVERDVIAVLERLGVAEDRRVGGRVILQEGAGGAQEAHIADAEFPVLL